MAQPSFAKTFERESTVRSGASAWTPLRQPVFRALWIASLTSNIGTWMQNVGAAWLMTSLTPSPVVVALVQAATSLPVFLIALPAGALADIVDRRRLLILTQGWMLVSAAMLGLLTIIGIMSPWILLSLTFALGLGAAMNAPAWQAIVSEIVSPSELQDAVALNAAGFNLARAIGPALGGLIVAAAGPGPVFLVNAASFVVVLLVVYRWKRQAPTSRLHAEHMIGAIRAGIRYVEHAPPLQTVLVRSGVFILCAAALWALLPLLARDQLGLGAVGYGVLLGCLGIGAITGAGLLPRIKQKFSLDALVLGAAITNEKKLDTNLSQMVKFSCLTLADRNARSTAATSIQNLNTARSSSATSNFRTDLRAGARRRLGLASGIGSSSGRHGDQVMTLRGHCAEVSLYFATTLPELFAAMCSKRKMGCERSGSRRLNSFS